MKWHQLPLMAPAMMSVIAFAQPPAPNAPAPAPRPRALVPYAILEMDANKDGTVTRGEFIAADTARFNRMDADKNGKLTIAERNTERTPASGMRPMTVPAPGAPPVKAGAVDADGDGLVSRDEYFFNLGPIWARYDANGDDKITPDEIAPPPGPGAAPAAPGGAVPAR